MGKGKICYLIGKGIMEEIEIKTGIQICIDYFKCSFPIQVNKEEMESQEAIKIRNDIMTFFNIPLNDHDPLFIPKYRYNWTLGENIILQIAGPEFSNGYPSCIIELKGQGCREFETRNPDKNWFDVIKFFKLNYQGKLKRIDVAIDDYDGKISYDYLEKKLDSKQFASVFQNKDVDHLGNINTGRTLNLGGHGSSIQLCIYEKDKQQRKLKKEHKQKFWMRYEMRFSKNRADDFIYTMFQYDITDFNRYTMQVLYNILDIKKDCNRGIENISHVETDKPWLDFLGNVEKCALLHADTYESNYATYQNWIRNHAGKYVLYLFATNNYELEAVITSLLQAGADYADDINKSKLKTINSYLRKRKLPLLAVEDIEKLKNEILEIIEERRLPF